MPNTLCLITFIYVEFQVSEGSILSEGQSFHAPGHQSWYHLVLALGTHTPKHIS